MPRKRHPARTLLAIPGKARPPPPDRLRDDMKQLWREVVGRMPGGWFTGEMLPVLEEYCRNVCYCRDFTAWLDPIDTTKLTKEDWPQYNQIYLKYVKATQTMGSCAVRLQLTGASQRGPMGAKALKATDPISSDKPWDGDTANGNGQEAPEAAH